MERPPECDLTVGSVRLTHSGPGPQSVMHAMLWAATVHCAPKHDSGYLRHSKTAAKSFEILFSECHPSPIRVSFSAAVPHSRCLSLLVFSEYNDLIPPEMRC